MDFQVLICLCSYMGELFLEQEIEVRAADNRHD